MTNFNNIDFEMTAHAAIEDAGLTLTASERDKLVAAGISRMNRMVEKHDKTLVTIEGERGPYTVPDDGKKPIKFTVHLSNTRSNVSLLNALPDFVTIFARQADLFDAAATDADKKQDAFAFDKTDDGGTVVRKDDKVLPLKVGDILTAMRDITAVGVRILEKGQKIAVGEFNLDGKVLRSTDGIDVPYRSWTALSADPRPTPEDMPPLPETPLTPPDEPEDDDSDDGSAPDPDEDADYDVPGDEEPPDDLPGPDIRKGQFWTDELGRVWQIAGVDRENEKVTLQNDGEERGTDWNDLIANYTRRADFEAGATV